MEQSRELFQWQMFSDALLSRGYGQRKHNGKTLADWREVLCRGRLNHVAFTAAKIAIRQIAARATRDHLGIDHLEFAVVFVCQQEVQP